MTEKELIVTVMRQNMMLAGMISELGMSLAAANNNDKLLKEIKMLGLKFHAITKEAIDQIKDE